MKSRRNLGADPRDIPLTWQSGSEQDLRRLVRAICHTEPELFTNQALARVDFQAATEDKRGGFMGVSLRQSSYGLPHPNNDFRNHHSGRLESLCELAFRLNPCIGTKWVSLSPERGITQRERIRIRITVEPPSAHDRAEALLTMFDWLDDKLHHPQKRVQAGLPPYPLRQSEGS